MDVWEHLIRSAGVMHRIYGDPVAVSPEPTYVGVWPVGQSGGPRAEMVIIRPSAAVHFMVVPDTEDIPYILPAVPNTIGPYSAKLAAGVEYVLPLGPNVHTLGFVDAASVASTPVDVRWIVIRR